MSPESYRKTIFSQKIYNKSTEYICQKTYLFVRLVDYYESKFVHRQYKEYLIINS